MSYTPDRELPHRDISKGLGLALKNLEAEIEISTHIPRVQFPQAQSLSCDHVNHAQTEFFREAVLYLTGELARFEPDSLVRLDAALSTFTTKAQIYFLAISKVGSYASEKVREDYAAALNDLVKVVYGARDLGISQARNRPAPNPQGPKR